MSLSDLELKCLKFAKGVKGYCRAMKHDAINLVYIKQVVRSSSSIGANYIEANERLGKKDMLMKLKISRREAKETGFWLELLEGEGDENRRNELMQEALELRKILSAIIIKIEKS